MLTLKNSKKIFWVITGFIILTITVLIISIILTGKSNKASRQEFISKIPYYQQEFTISYSKNKDQIYINVIKEPYDLNKQKAEKWIKDNGQNPQQLKILYTPTNVFRNLNK